MNRRIPHRTQRRRHEARKHNLERIRVGPGPFAFELGAESKQLPTQTVTISGTVATIDHAKRVVNIKTSDGKFETVDVPAGAKRFDELKVGDKVSLDV